MPKEFGNNARCRWPIVSPFLGVSALQRGEVARVGGYIGRRKDRHVRINFGCCAINILAVKHTFPLFGIFWPPLGDTVPFWGHFERLYCSYGPPYLFKFWSIWDKYNGRHTQISHFGGIPPLNLWKTFCGIICFMDPYYSAKFHPSATNAVVAIHLVTYVRTYLPTTLTVPIMRLAKHINNSTATQQTDSRAPASVS